MAENGEVRDKGHEEDARRAPSRLIYAMQAIADLIESIIIVMIEDVDAFKRHFIRLYGADHPLASLCARDLVQGFLSTTEAVLIIIFRSSRTNLNTTSTWTTSCRASPPPSRSVSMATPAAATPWQPTKLRRGTGLRLNGFSGHLVKIAMLGCDTVSA